jgi:PRC-barrel domain
LTRSDQPQVSWIVLEPGATVIASGGEEAGTVRRVVGDADADVFTGIAIRTGMFGSERLVPSERIGAIWTDRVEVDLTKDELERLPEFQDPAAVRIEPASTGFFGRLFGRR